MNVLSIESSGLVASVALMSEDILVGEYTIHNKKTHSQTLLPMISDMLDMAEVDRNEIDCVAVSAGPGSFTGLRIGASTAKGLAWTIGVPVVPVSSLMGLAANISQEGAVVCPIMDARRSQVYYGIYRIRKGIPEEICKPDVTSIEEAVEKVNQIGEPAIYLGDGVPVFQEIVKERSVIPVTFADARNRYQSGASVARLGAILFERGQYVPAGEFAPVYLRKSQAEREREEKGKLS